MLRNAQPARTPSVQPSSMAPQGPSLQRPILLDVRNGYEWDAGHFDGAARPLEVAQPPAAWDLPVLTNPAAAPWAAAWRILALSELIAPK